MIDYVRYFERIYTIGYLKMRQTMRFNRGIVGVGVVIIALALALSSLGFARATRGPSALGVGGSNPGCQDWTVLPSQNVGSFSNSLTGVAALSGTDAWAVGTYTTSGDRNIPQTLAEH